MVKRKMVRMTKAQRTRESVLKRRLQMSSRLRSDNDARNRVRGHKGVAKANTQLKKLYDSVYNKKGISTKARRRRK